MSVAIVFRPEAEGDLLAARNWYEQQQPGLGDTFLDAVRAVLIRIELMPEMYAIVFRGTRRAKLRIFPYLIYYRALADVAEVVAVFHGSRDPKLWQERVN